MNVILIIWIKPYTYSNYEKILLVGDFNSEATENCIESFLYKHDLKDFVKEKTYFKNIQNSSCIDLLLTIVTLFRKPRTAQKMKFSSKYLFSECDKIRSFLRIWSHLLKKYLMEKFIFCVVTTVCSGLSVFHKLKFIQDKLLTETIKSLIL